MYTRDAAVRAVSIRARTGPRSRPKPPAKMKAYVRDPKAYGLGWRSGAEWVIGYR
jgi:hypothetical protein